MEKSKVNIFYAWALLICFIAGQAIIYTHQHKIIVATSAQAHIGSKGIPHAVVYEKCSICDAMHHISAVIEHYAYFGPNIVTKHFYKVYNYDFVSIALILSAGRAPPVSVSC